MKKKIFFLVMVLSLLGCSNNSRISKETSDRVYNGAFLGSTEIIQGEIRSGLNIDDHYHRERTLLIEAVRNNNLETVSQLINQGANIEARDVTGKTAIFHTPSIEMLELLISNGAQMEVIDNDKTSLMTYFISNKPKEYSHYLIEKGLYSRGGPLGAIDEKLGFLLVERNDSYLIDRIVKTNPNIFKIKNEIGNYPIFYAQDSKAIMNLLNIDYNLAETNIYGENILGEVYLKAVKNNNLNVIEKLISKGVNPQYSSYGITPISLARENNNREILGYLQRVGVK